MRDALHTARSHAIAGTGGAPAAPDAMGNSCEPQRAECCAECCGPVLVLDEPTLEHHEYGARPSSACNKTDEDIPLLLRHSPAGKSHTPAQPMAWDEQAYGREYDLDVYHIVAVNDFNMGAMENKVNPPAPLPQSLAPRGCVACRGRQVTGDPACP